MHAVLVTVDIEEGRVAEATQLLTGQVIPRVKDSDGFLHGTWARVEDDGGVTGRSMIVFKTEGDARVAAQLVITEGPPPGAPVSIRSVEVAEVVAEA